MVEIGFRYDLRKQITSVGDSTSDMVAVATSY